MPSPGINSLSDHPSWRDQLLIIFAIGARSRRTRFAGGALGYLWAFLTPVVWIFFIVVLFNMLGRQVPIFTSAALFVASGILPYLLFRQSVTGIASSAILNRHLLYLSRVKVAHITIAAAALEIVTAAIAAIVIFGGITLILEAPPPASIGKVFLGVLLACSVGISIGRLFGAFGRWSDTSARFMPIALRPMFWISGLFYTATELPGTAVNILWYNPLFHCIEIVREGYFLGYESPISEMIYPLLVSIVAFALAAIVEVRIHRLRLARHRL